MSNAQKTPLGFALHDFARGKINASLNVRSKSPPCQVTKVLSNNIVQVKFLYKPGAGSLPQNVTIPVATSEYVRVPVQVGDLGVAASSDFFLGGVSGLGNHTADTSTVGNLTSLWFVPLGNTGWSPVDNNALVLYGPNGVVIEDKAKKSTITLTPSQITASVPRGDPITLIVPSGRVHVAQGDLVVDGNIYLGGQVYPGGLPPGGGPTVIPLNNNTTLPVPDGSINQQNLVVDNLGTAGTVQPTVTGTLNVAGIARAAVTVNQPGGALWMIWDNVAGNWFVPTWIGLPGIPGLGGHVAHEMPRGLSPRLISGSQTIFLGTDLTLALDDGMTGAEVRICDNLGLATTNNPTITGTFYVAGNSYSSITPTQDGSMLWCIWDDVNSWWFVPTWVGALGG